MVFGCLGVWVFTLYYFYIEISNEKRKQKKRFFNAFTDRSFSDIQQIPRRHYNNNSPSPRRRPFIGTPTRV